MDAATLAAVMGNAIPMARYEALCSAWNELLIRAECNTVNRVAMVVAQVGHESGGLKWMQEIWGPTAAQKTYQGRMGNTAPGDGEKYKGHGPLQITGKQNHAAVSKWAFERGYVPTPTYFVDHPDELAGDRYGFTGVLWYWTVARNMNSYADRGDILGATKAVNGGTNGLADRQARYDRALKLGDKLLPTQPEAPGVALSQNGWIANDRNQVQSQNVPGTSLNLTVRRDAAGQVLLEVASAFDRLVQDVDNGRGALDDWGYAERPVRGGTALSNHASGTAIDLNVLLHPLGTDPHDNFTQAQIDTIHRILAVCGGVVRWGGDYVGRKDPMHFEINDGQSINDCIRALAAIREFNAGHTTEDDDMTDAERQMLNECHVMLHRIYEQLNGGGSDPFVKGKEYTGWQCHDGKPRTLVDIGRRGLEQLDGKA